jgi:hypothetical protein
MRRKHDEPITLADLKKLGMEHYQTGGNCTALRIDIEETPPRYILITQGDDSFAPENWLDPITVGFYREGYYDQGDCFFRTRENSTDSEWDKFWGETWELWECLTFEDFVDVWYDGEYDD